MIRIRLALEYLSFRLRYPPPVKFVRRNALGTYYSQAGQDLVTSAALFQQLDQRPNQVVVDIGANHPTKFSNSFFLERYFGCKTLAIDPLHEFKEQWASIRPAAEFIPLAIGSKEDFLDMTVPVVGDRMYSSLQQDATKSFQQGECEVRRVRVSTLRQVLEDRNIGEVLLLSIDVEGFELEVLKGIDFGRVKFMAILCENNSDKYFGSDDVRDFLTQKGYVYYARIGLLDDLFLSQELLRR